MNARLVLVHGQSPAHAAGDARSDADLVSACGAGETSALGVLFDRYHAQVRRFLFRLAGTDARDLDDLVQLTFLQALGAAKRFRSEAAVKTWLFGIAANVVRHHVRADVRRKSFLTTLGVQPRHDHNAEGALQLRQQSADLKTAIANLPHDLRVVLVLCDIENVAGVQVATLLNIPAGTVWRRLHDARKRVRHVMGPV